jgi:AcrR family transcriptional regulator
MNTNGRTYTIRTFVRKIESMTEIIDGRRVRGDASRRVVLESAADLASVEGLDGLSIGRLATAARVSKSGVATLFGSKERLQLATVDAAVQRFKDTVLVPARVEPRGIRRIVALLDAWIAYSRDRVFPGGCFFAAVAVDLDAKPGPVHDAVARAYDGWNDYVAVSVGYAIDQGELDAGADAAQLAFEFMALLDASNTRSVMTGSNEPYRFARRALVARLLAAGADPEVVRPLAEVDDGA